MNKMNKTVRSQLAMHSKMRSAACASLLLMLSACSKPNATPDETSRNFLGSVETTDVDKFTGTLSTNLKAKVQASVPDLKKSLNEGSLKIKQCGGYKNLTSNYSVAEGSTSVEGYTLVEYKGNCPVEKQYLKLVKQNDVWLVDQPGPSVKQ